MGHGSDMSRQIETKLHLNRVASEPLFLIQMLRAISKSSDSERLGLIRLVSIILKNSSFPRLSPSILWHSILVFWNVEGLDRVIPLPISFNTGVAVRLSCKSPMNCVPDCNTFEGSIWLADGEVAKKPKITRLERYMACRNVPEFLHWLFATWVCCLHPG